MPLQATSGAASYDGFGGGPAAVPNYIEDVFSTWLYTGNSTTGGTQTITNNIDLSTKGGMVWIKGRSAASNHILTDTTRGAGTSATNNQALASNLTSAEDLGGSSYDYLSSFSTTGFVVTQGGTTTATRGTNYNNVTYASWTFREQPKFFDVVTFTSSASGTNQRISHSLGSVPGCIIVKSTGVADNWFVWHRSLPSATNDYLYLNTTAETQSTGNMWGSSSPTSTDFGINPSTFGTSRTFVAYLFAHDAGGFGLTGTDNVISCGSYTGNGSASGPTITLGYEPQWIMLKNTNNGATNWAILDNMRGIPVGSDDQLLFANTSGAESAAEYISPTATGFRVTGTFAAVNENGSNIIYIAIRRGPMKTPTTGTSVFGLSARGGSGGNATVSNGSGVKDLAIIKASDAPQIPLWVPRLTGTGYLTSSATDAEIAAGTTVLQANPWDVMTGVKVGTSSAITNLSGYTYINYLLSRAPGFFDVVCYTGTGSNRTVSHNLGVVPEMMIVKRRDNTGSWITYWQSLGATKYQVISTAAAGTLSTVWNDTAPTSSVFTVGTDASLNASGGTYVNYLFATVAGVSKVGSYTGDGTVDRVIDCGFTSGARFILLKKTSTTSDWYVYDTARGISSSGESSLSLNTTAAESGVADVIDPASVGFSVGTSGSDFFNESGVSYIFLAIA